MFATTDRNIRCRKNLARRMIAIVALGSGRWTFVKNSLTAIAAAVGAATPGSFAEMEIPIA